MATILGVTRSVVTRAAGSLQHERMILYTRACECYGAVKEEYERCARAS
jgi:hypothetical protein